MFGIGGGELMFVLLVVLMLFGSDKIPEVARGIGRGMQQLKNATNDIKSEIQNSADIDGIKKSFTEIGNDAKNLGNDVASEIDKAKENVKENIEDMSGPIKRNS
ncbi:Sec-independent protein translocase subunit TatA/TatB [Flavobacterium rhizosphaerae]|uniref:Sec-independent protein translocase protein TatA n=1 Tax=Flavobacterium rhizosphaerae TaxID=3163298 RepID=A0ABW8Z2C4_9FLAO